MALTSGLISHWKLEETGVSDRLDSVGTNHLTPTATIAAATGKIGSGCDFERDDARKLEIVDNASLSLTGAMTIGCWLKAESVGITATLMSKWFTTTSQRSYLCRQMSTNVLQFFVSSNGTTNTSIMATTLGAISAGTWYYFLAGYDLTNIWIQPNGGTRDSTAFSAGIFDGTAAFAIGYETTNFFDGVIDEVSIWNRSLSTAEGAQMWNGGYGLELTGGAFVSTIRQTRRARPMGIGIRIGI